MPIFDKEAELMKRGEIRQLQLERLQAIIFRCHKSVSFYRKKFEKAALTPDDIQSLDDISRLPFTTKADLRDSYPYGMFAVPLREIVRIHSSSGATGLPTVVGYTRNDLKNWSVLCARVMFAAGVTADDVVQIAFDYGIFTGAFGIHQGAERIGASVIPTSVGNTDRQIKIIQDYKTTALACNPAYALGLAEKMAESGVDPKTTSLKIGLFGGEPWSESTRAKIEDKLFIRAMDNYGISEVLGPGVAGECEARSGLHINEDHFYAEIINPDTLEKLPDGVEGELVLTTLTKEGFPLIRYRTGDITKLNTEKCSCGRELARMSRVFCRADDAIIVRGINIYPARVESLIKTPEGILPEYQIVVENVDSQDQVQVLIEVTEDLFLDEMRRLREYHLNLEKTLKASLGLAIKAKLVEPKAILREGGSIKRIVDRRSNNSC
ncbi:MAG TPA: phenylacetate--CoA ligase [bacterium]|nr:phenylacetate--CoA ligase [bacterium]